MKRNSTSYWCYLCIATNSSVFESWNLCVASCPVQKTKVMYRPLKFSETCNSTAVWKNWAKLMRWQTDKSCWRISFHFTRKQILSAATVNWNFVTLCSARCAWFLFGFSLFFFHQQTFYRKTKARNHVRYSYSKFQFLPTNNWAPERQDDIFNILTLVQLSAFISTAMVDLHLRHPHVFSYADDSYQKSISRWCNYSRMHDYSPKIMDFQSIRSNRGSIRTTRHKKCM